ncbi:hypothetical protein LIER_10912 [Lithospermum erythrorhizon]|uniref:Retrotransposon gag domain-containing protein n=1 Tax=Lithospermum erythrorhizon TaxID=34254 RepID=A0AAV3PMV1_LITER
MELPANSIDSYASIAEAFIAKFSTSITNKEDERALIYLEQGPGESLRDFHEGYKAILNNIPSIDNKIAYMVFYRGLNYDKLKKALILDTPLTKGELTRVVNKYINLVHRRSHRVGTECVTGGKISKRSLIPLHVES